MALAKPVKIKPYMSFHQKHKRDYSDVSFLYNIHVWLPLFNATRSIDLGMSLEWTRTTSPRLRLDGHHPGEAEFSNWHKVVGGNRKVGRALLAQDQGGQVWRSAGVGYLLLHVGDGGGGAGGGEWVAAPEKNWKICVHPGAFQNISGKHKWFCRRQQCKWQHTLNFFHLFIYFPRKIRSWLQWWNKTEHNLNKLYDQNNLEMYCDGRAKRDGLDMDMGWCTTCCKGPVMLETDRWCLCATWLSKAKLNSSFKILASKEYLLYIN